MTLIDKFWLWGQSPNAHHEEANNIYNLPGVNRMTPEECAKFFGIENMCRVVMEDKPAPPFENEAAKFDDLSKVVWSIMGSGGSNRNNNGGNDLDEVLKIAKTHPNIIAGIMDDFMRPSRMEAYSPSVVAEYRNRLRVEAERPLELWSVVYTHELTKQASPFLEEFDVITMWTWCAKDLPKVEENYNKLQSLLKSEKRIMAGCYMWDYGDHKSMPMDLMKYQLEIYKKWLEEGKIGGVILCSNCIADIGLDTVDYTKEWLSHNGSLEG